MSPKTKRKIPNVLVLLFLWAKASDTADDDSPDLRVVGRRSDAGQSAAWGVGAGAEAEGSSFVKIMANDGMVGGGED